MDKISFQGLTSLTISPTAYEKVENTTRMAYTNLRLGSNCKLHKSKVCALETDPQNLTVIVKNEDNGFYKYVPLIEDIHEFLYDISKGIEDLKKTARKEPLTAWIVGGTRLESPQGQKVIDTLNKVADVVCDKPDIDASILVGSHTGEEVFVIRPGVTQLKMALDKKINPQNDLQSELEGIFDIVDINKTHLSYEV
jgi:hypothetical protein